MAGLQQLPKLLPALISSHLTEGHAKVNIFIVVCNYFVTLLGQGLHFSLDWCIAKQKMTIGNTEDGFCCQVRIHHEVIENIVNLYVSWENMLH